VSGRLIAWLGMVGALAALNYATRYAGDVRPDRDVFYQWETFFGALIQFALMLGLALWIARRGPARQLLALRPPRSWARAAGMMLVVFVAVMVVGALLEPILEPGEEQGLVPERWRPERAEEFAANFAVTATLIPVVEELTFRGLGYSLLARYGRAVAIVGTGVIFGLAHGLVLALPILVGFGIGLAWLRSRSESIYPGMVLHGLFNAASLALGVFVIPENG
jgi:membrane protease YdiL (CAAX protease family)